MNVILFANTDWYLYNFRRDLAIKLKQRGDQVLLLSPAGEYAPRLQALGFRWLEFPLSRRGMNPFSECLSVLRLVKLYQRERPDLVHHFTIKCVLYGTLAARLAGIRSIVNSITGLGYVFLPGSPWKRFLRGFVRLGYRLLLRGTQTLFENDDDRQAFIRYHLIQPEDGHFIPGVGVDTTRFTPTPLPVGKPVVLLAARMLWDKGIGEYIEAARRLQAQGVQARFLLAGRVDPGNPSSIPESQIQAWQQQGVVEWQSWVENMADLLQQVSIVCLPSYREGLPTILIEAAACARAVVASDVPGCRLTVQDGLTGLLVRERDVDSLTEALRKLILAPDLCQQMGLAGRRLAEDMFSSEKVLRAILDVYASLVKRQA